MLKRIRADANYLKKSTLLIIIVSLIVVLAAGLWFLLAPSKIAQPASNAPKTAGVGPGEHCGGNTVHPPQCRSGYHCAPEPGSHLPFGDVGGICVAD